MTVNRRSFLATLAGGFALALAHLKVHAQRVGQRLWVGKHTRYQTIQSAINDAESFDTVMVLPGEYGPVVLKDGVSIVGRQTFTKRRIPNE